MAKIICPNKQYTGVSAGVPFIQGQGETNNERLIEWFKEHGYKVVDDEKKLEDMNAEELKLYAEENGIDIGNSTSVKGILKKIKDGDSEETNDEE